MAPALRCAATALVVSFCLLPAAALQAQDVTLTSRDGGVELSGTLQSYDGEFYRVDTEFGLLTLAAEGVDCAGPGCPDLTGFVAEFTLAGAPTLGNALLPALIQDFADTQGLALHVEEVAETRRFLLADATTHAPVARISLRLSSSDAGLIDLLAGDADIALSLAELRDDAVQARVIALDAFVPVVGRGNPLERIGLAELAAVLAGEIDNWADLGWLDAPIAVHARDAGSGVQQALEAQLLAPLGLPPASGTIRHDSDAALLGALARDPLAIGMALLSETGSTAPVTLQGSCGFTLPATALAIKAEDYPLTAPLLIHTRTGRLPLQVRRFLSHLQSSSAQAAIRSAGFVDQRPEAQPIAAQGRRLANAVLAADGEDVGLADLRHLVAEMEDSRRLSTTFRFETGATELDLQSRGNVASLARDLEAGIHDGREIVFVGFTDGDGDGAANMALARSRAEEVRAAVRAAAPLLEGNRVALSVEAFGEAMPMACDDTDWGRGVNRRVEVWLR